MLKTRLLGATALLGTLLIAAPAFAQTAEPTPPADSSTDIPATGATADPESEVTVTGSRIRIPNAQSPIPVTTVAGEAFFEQGRNNIADVLNDLPQLRNTFSQQNVGAGVGVAGLSLLDLRGLGTSRTLVLVNGRRHVGSDTLITTVGVDINSIPADLIERVDVVTGGNSAVYGSDAIAGVVNFVLRRNYDGVQIRANAAVAEEGFGGNQYVSVLAGKNFADGRGNIAVHAEYARQERIFGSDIPWYGRADGFSIIDVDPSLPATGNSDGFPDRAFFRDLRSAAINRYGLVPVNQATATPTCGTGIASTNGATSTVGGTPYSCTYLFTAAGRATAQTGTRIGSGPNGTFVGGNGQTGRESTLLSVLAPQERYNANVLAHFEFSPAFEVFAEGKYSRVTGAGLNVASEFIQGTYTQYDYRERVRLDNPFLNTADRATLAAAILASGCNTSLTATCGARQARASDGGVIGGALSAADRAAIADGSYRFVLSKNFLDAGIRDQLFKRETYRAVAGVRGTFNDDWSYELAGNYGEFRERTRNSGFFDKQRFELSFDAGLNPNNNQIQCRSQFDPAAARQHIANTAAGTAFLAARLAADIAACIPFNPFGDTSNNANAARNAAAAQYFTVTSADTSKITQLDFSGFVAGDTSGFFNLPGGPVRFSLGGEYRRDKAKYDQDPFTFDAASYTTYLSLLGFDAPATKVKEGFGELQIPIVKDLPFISELSISGAGRVSDYNNSAGTVYSYNYGGVYAPVRDIRFRAQYGRAVRAPNVSETSTPLTPNFANGFSDPCRRDAIGTGSQFRAANCRTALGATLDNPTFALQPTYNLKVLSGSNPNLGQESSDSWTIGGVIQPRFVPNLSISVDYYNIKVKDVITAVSAQQVANLCYDLATLDNPFCALIKRNLTAGPGSDSELPGQILSNTLIQASQNFAKLQRRGIDTQVSYRANFNEHIGLGLNAIYTHVLDNSNYTNPADPSFENVLKKEIGNPADEVVLNADLKFNNFTIGYSGHLIGKMYLNTYEDYNSVGGRAPENADYADIKQYPIVTYHALRFEWNLRNLSRLASEFQFYGGVDNIFDKKPPYGLTATAGGGAIYDIRGRNLYAGFRARF